MNELKCLNENRVQAYNAKQWRLFTLRAYVTIVTGDMIALQKIMMMKSPSGKSPCKACNIYSTKSLGNEQGRGKIQYYPHLFRPDPLNLRQLLLRRHVRQTICDVCIANKPISSRILELLECLSYWSFELSILPNLSLMIQCIWYCRILQSKFISSGVVHRKLMLEKEWTLFEQEYVRWNRLAYVKFMTRDTYCSWTSTLQHL